MEHRIPKAASAEEISTIYSCVRPFHIFHLTIISFIALEHSVIVSPDHFFSHFFRLNILSYISPGIFFLIPFC